MVAEAKVGNTHATSALQLPMRWLAGARWNHRMDREFSNLWVRRDET